MTPEKERFYENATQKLLRAIDSMGMERLARLRAKNIALLFRDSFKLPDVKYKTFYPDLGAGMKKLTYDSDGFCRAASVNFAMLNGDVKNWKLMYIDNLWTYGPHHYLLHTPSNIILDLTYDQYEVSGLRVPYFLGRQIPIINNKENVEGRFADALNLPIAFTNKQKE